MPEETTETPFPAPPDNPGYTQVAEGLKAIFETEAFKSSGRLPYEVFEQISMHLTMPCLELVLLRRNMATNEVEVLLCQRDADDKWFANEWHSAGVVIVPNEMGVKLPFDRILGKDGELRGGVTIVSGVEPSFVRLEMRTAEQTHRGPEITQVYFAPAEGESVVGKFFPVSSLAEADPSGFKLMKHHRPMILAAVEAFEAAGY